MLLSEQIGYQFDAKKHVHLLNGRPLIGTSTACRIIAKNLSWWASGMACRQMGWLPPKEYSKKERLECAEYVHNKIKAMTTEEYLDFVDMAYKAHDVKLDSSAVVGKNLHAMLEDWIKAEMAGQILLFIDPSIMPFIKWAKINVKRFLFSEMHCYSERHWLGGVADFAFEDMEGRIVLGDFKSSADAFFNQWCQCALYDIQLAELGGFSQDGKKVMEPMNFDYHVIFAARAGLDKPFFNYKIDRTRKASLFALNLHKEYIFWKGES